MNKFILIICFFILIVFYACIKFEPVSPIPEISYTSVELVTIIDTSLDNPNLIGAILIFDFIDGDADFGIYRSIASDLSLPDSERFNLFLLPYYKLDGIYYDVEQDTNFEPPFYPVFYNPKLDRVGQNKTVKGIITLNIYDLPIYDTIKYDFYIKDRAGHRSNIESTEDMGLD